MGLFSDDESQDYLNRALEQFNQVQTPTIASETVNNLPQETVQGTVTPGTIDPAQQRDTEFNNIALDPATRAAQAQALGGFTNIAGAGGLDANAMLGIQQAKDAANEQNAGMQGAIMKNAEATGEGGSGATLTQRLLAARDAANTTAGQGLQEAAMAQNNRQNALQQMASIGGTMNTEDYDQAAAKAASQNAINASNTAAKNAAKTTNVSNNMAGQEFNVNNAQTVNANNTTANQGNVYYNAQLPQQQFNNDLAKAQSAAGTYSNAADISQKNQSGILGMVGKGIGAIGQIAGSYAGAKTGADAGATGDSYGGVVPGEASVTGDSPTNDTQPIMASPGELVIPRSVPKDGKHMEEFARHAPVAGDPKKRVNLVDFMKRKHG